MAPATASLESVSPELLDRNPDNPRLIFREEELNHLLTSISQVGIEVPLTVYRDGGRYTLIDGERRWRCACKLNLASVPVLVQPKPTRLENILMMFNIHSVRVDWDPLPTAIKLKQVQDLLKHEGRPSGLSDLAALTGLSTVRLRRLFELLALPAKYRNLILNDLENPKDQRRYSEDLFLEIFKALNAVKSHTPGVFSRISEVEFVDSMVRKYVAGTAKSVVDFRSVSKIARGALAGVSGGETAPIILQLVREPNYSIEDAFRDSVGSAYEQRDLITRVRGVSEKLRRIRSRKQLDHEFVQLLLDLREEINRLLGSGS